MIDIETKSLLAVLAAIALGAGAAGAIVFALAAWIFGVSIAWSAAAGALLGVAAFILWLRQG